MIKEFYLNNKVNKLVVGQVQSGKTKFIIDTTMQEIKTDTDLIIILGGTTKLLLEQIKIRLSQEFYPNTVNLHPIIYTEKDHITKIPKDKCIFIILKSAFHLQKLQKIIQNFSSKKTKMILIDDESDFGSLNIGKDQNSSKIYNLIQSVGKKFDNCKIISITATPYGDFVSKDARPFDEVELLFPGDKYTGIDFFEENDNLYTVVNTPNEIENNRDFWEKIIIDHINRCSNSYKKNLCTQLIINTSLIKLKHKRLSEEFREIIESLRFSFNLKNTVLDVSIAIRILNELSKNIIIMNSDHKEDIEGRNAIIIGGALISRGYTFENPGTFVMLNSPKEKIAADTLLQRARWFGYRMEKIEFLKVFISPKIRHAYSECQKLQEIVYEKLTNYKKENFYEIRNTIKEYKNDLIIPTQEVKNK